MYTFSQKLSNKSRFTMLLSQWHFRSWLGLSGHKRKKKIYDSRRFSKYNSIFAAKRAWVSPQKRKKKNIYDSSPEHFPHLQGKNIYLRFSPRAFFLLGGFNPHTIKNNIILGN